LITSFGSTVFTASSNCQVSKSERTGDHQYEVKNILKVEGGPVAMSASDKLIFVLSTNSILSIIDAASFTLIKTHEFKDFPATSCVYSDFTKELWVGDKKGLIHVLDVSDMSERELIEKKHNHQVTVMKTSRDGKLIASGDSYRYIYVFDTETRTEVGCYPYHSAKIIHLDFNKEGTLLLTASLDLGVGVANLSDKTKKVLHSNKNKF
jgi:WD40 repeat protein